MEAATLPEETSPEMRRLASRRQDARSGLVRAAFFGCLFAAALVVLAPPSDCVTSVTTIAGWVLILSWAGGARSTWDTATALGGIPGWLITALCITPPPIGYVGIRIKQRIKRHRASSRHTPKH